MAEKRTIRVKLLGELGRRFTRELRLYAPTPAIAIKGIIANFPEARQYIQQGQFHLLRVKPGSAADYGEDELETPIGDHDFILCPVVAGSGGVFRVIAGAAIVGLSLAVPFLGTTGVLLGASLALGGVAQLLTPTPRTPEGENERKDSFLTDRAARTNRLNDPIPVQFGLLRIRDPFVVSSGITTEEIID